MPVKRPHNRPQRIGEQIQKELAELIRVELKDPRVGMVTLTGVEVSADYSHAKVFFTLLGDQEKLEETMNGLKRSAGFLRTCLSKILTIRMVPALKFVHDPSINQGIYMSNLIDKAIGIQEVSIENENNDENNQEDQTKNS